MSCLPREFPPHIKLEQEHIHRQISNIKEREFHQRCLTSQTAAMITAGEKGDKNHELACARAAVCHKYALSKIPKDTPNKEHLNELIQQELDLLLGYLAFE